MNRLSKRAFLYGRLIITSGLLGFLIFFGTQKVLAVTNDYPYLIKVNRYQNTITVYEKDRNGEYKVPVKAFICSVGRKGTETILGTYKTKEKYRWKALMGDVWGQYSTRIVGGILFHSVYYYENGNPATLANKEYNKLGSAASHGCIRLTVGDAKWIYDNCPVGTTVIIYDDKTSPGPMGKPEAIKLPSSVRWDPTDPISSNPYKDKKPTINGVKSRSIPWGEEIDLKQGVTAKSFLGTDITQKLEVEGIIHKYEPGDYKIIYTVTDVLGRTASKTITVTVEKIRNVAEFNGFRDQVVSGRSKITTKEVLSGVEIYLDGVLVDQKDIRVAIEKVSGDEYLVTIRIYSGEGILAAETVTYRIDNEAPVLTGINDRILDFGQIPDKTYALRGIGVSDNYSDLHPEDINVTIEEILEDESDKFYLISYEATDDAGNTVQYTVHFNY